MIFAKAQFLTKKIGLKSRPGKFLVGWFFQFSCWEMGFNHLEYYLFSWDSLSTCKAGNISWIFSINLGKLDGNNLE